MPRPSSRSATRLRREIPIGIALLLSPIAATAEDSKDRMERMQRSPNYRDGRFENREDSPMRQGSTVGLFRELFFGKEVRVPPRPLPVAPLMPSPFTEPPQDLQVVWLGHSTLILEIEGKRLLVDPVFESHASPVPVFAKRFQPPVLRREDLPRLDAVLISHDHYDHLETESMRFFGKKGLPFFMPLGVGGHLEKWGVNRDQLHEFDWWEETVFKGLRLVCTPARHFSGRTPFDARKTLWASWSLIGKERRIFYSGDGGYGRHFKEIGDRLGPFDLVLMENGAYNEGWPYMHLFPEQGAQAHLDLRGRALMAVHWGMFNLSIHPWYEPIERLSRAAKEKNITLLTPRLGEALRRKDGRWEGAAPDAADRGKAMEGADSGGPGAWWKPLVGAVEQKEPRGGAAKEGAEAGKPAGLP